MFKVNNKDTRATPWAYFKPWSSVFIAKFEQGNAGQDITKIGGGFSEAQAGRPREHLSSPS